MAASDPSDRTARRSGPVFRRVESHPFSDAYNLLLALPLWGLILAVFAMFLATNLVFAGLLLLDGASWPQMAGLSDAFFLSVQTITGVNFGYPAPVSAYSKWVMTAEAFAGLLALALGTGLFFARISRPSARISFSKVAVITLFDGRRTFMFRAGNRRGNQILNAEVTVNIARDLVTPEGHRIRRFDDLVLVKARAPLFAYTWTVMHVIDNESPLKAMTAESLDAANAELLVVLAGTDDRFGQTVHARCSYTPDDILFDRSFVDVLIQRPDGRWSVDFSRFHDTAVAQVLREPPSSASRV